MQSVSSTRRPFWRSWAFLEEGQLRGVLRHAYILPIIAVALWLRIVLIGQEHLYGDEAEYAIVARYLSRDFSFLAYPAIEGDGAQPFVSQPPLLLYLMAMSMKLFGPTDVAAILPSVFFGTATVGAVYFLGYRLGGRMIGLPAAALLAVLPFHVEMSRRGMLDAGFVFFVVLTTYFLVAWSQTRSRRHALGVGLATAATCLSKLPGVLVTPVVVLVAIVVLGTVAVRGARGRAARSEVKETALQVGLGVIPVGVGALLYLSLLAYLGAIGNLWVKLQWQLGRVDTTQAVSKEMAAISRDASFYLSDPKFGFPALMGSTVLILAGVGLAVLLIHMVRTRRLEHLIAPAMFLVLAAFFFWSDRKEGFYLLPLAPFVALGVGYAAYGVRRTIVLVSQRTAPQALQPKLAIAAVVVAALLVASPAWAHAEKSIKRHALGESQEKYFGSGTREAAAWIHENDPDAMMYGTLLGRFALHWYNEQPAMHWYVDQTRIEAKIQSGELRYIVYDDYLNLAFDRELMRGLIDKYNGDAVATFTQGWGQVSVFELHP